MSRFKLVAACLCLVAANSPHRLAADDTFGITISAPKIYEEGALRAMLEQAEAQLAALRPIGGAKFDAAIGALQGGRQTSAAFSLTAQGVAQPSVMTTETEALDTESGALETTGVQTVTTQAAASATPPTIAAFPALGATGFSSSARDLLAEQVALAYQIASLRLALDRATSDRFNIIGNTVIPRRPIVLGFTVGVDRPQKNHVAEVDLTLELTGLASGAAPSPALSLVSLLPAKDAYNVAAITDSSASIGAGQIVSAFQLGAGFAWGRKTYYVVRDVDTLSINRGPDLSKPQQVRVAWQFRPVLGRKIVEPGPRQVFVVLAIDDRTDGSSVSISAQADLRWVRTRSNGTLREHALREKTVPLGSLYYWQIFNKEVIAPFVDDLQLTLLSDRHAMVYARGYFLSTDSRILIGDRVIDRSNGLQLSDETALSFLVPLVDLARASDIHLINRHQVPVALRPAILPETPTPSPLTAPPCMFSRKADLGGYSVKVDLSGEPRPKVEDLLAIAGDTVVVGKVGSDPEVERGLPQIQALRETPCVGPGCTESTLRVVFDLPLDVVRSTRFMVIREVFGGPSRTVRCDMPPLPAIDRIAVVGKTDTHVRLALQGRLLSHLDHALLGSTAVHFTDQTDTVALLDAPKASIDGAEFLLVRVKSETAGQSGELLMVPFKQKAEVKKPVFGVALEVVQHFSGPWEVSGENFESIEAVSFEGLDLKKSVAGKKLTVQLVSKVTEHPAPRSLTVKLVDGSEVALPLTVRPRA